MLFLGGFFGLFWGDGKHHFFQVLFDLRAGNFLTNIFRVFFLGFVKGGIREREISLSAAKVSLNIRGESEIG